MAIDVEGDLRDTSHEFKLLLQLAQAAGEQLIVDLDDASRRTDQWKDEPLTNVLVEAALATCLGRLAETGCWGEANRIASNELWRIAGPLLEPGSLQCRARFKPRGYAGDYEMLHWIWTETCCDHPLGRAFDCYFQQQAAPQAVRNRTRQTAAALVDHCMHARDATGHADYHIVSVGSGPADDICRALASLPDERRARLQVTLIDLDPESLEFSRRQMAPFLRGEAIHGIRENLFRLPQNRRGDKILRRPDFLICSGLFDYLDDATATAMLRMFWESLAKRGRFMIWNFAPHNPTRAYMEWIGNWYLVYRTSDDLARLAKAADIPNDTILLESESLAVDLFLTAGK